MDLRLTWIFFKLSGRVDFGIGSVIFLAFHKFQLYYNDHHCLQWQFSLKWPKGNSTVVKSNWKNKIKGVRVGKNEWDFNSGVKYFFTFFAE